MFHAGNFSEFYSEAKQTYKFSSPYSSIATAAVIITITAGRPEKMIRFLAFESITTSIYRSLSITLESLTTSVYRSFHQLTTHPIQPHSISI
jgi:hypothetical protein